MTSKSNNKYKHAHSRGSNTVLKFLKMPKNRTLWVTNENLKLDVKTTISLSFIDIYS